MEIPKGDVYYSDGRDAYLIIITGTHVNVIKGDGSVHPAGYTYMYSMNSWIKLSREEFLSRFALMRLRE